MPDFQCILVFVVALIAFGALTVRPGANVAKLVAPFDDQGRQCGFAGEVNGAAYDMTDTPFLAFGAKFATDLIKAGSNKNSKVGDFVADTCVKTCPGESMVDLVPNVCVQSSMEKQFFSQLEGIGESGGAMEGFMMLQHARWGIVVSLLTVLVITGVWFVFLYKFEAYIVWACLIGIVLGETLLTVLLLQRAQFMPQPKGKDLSSQFVAGCCAGVFALITVLLICFKKKDIDKANAIMKVASNFITSVKQVMLVPLMCFISYFIWLIVFMACFASFLSACELVKAPVGFLPQLKMTQNEQYMTVFMIFVACWLMWLVFFCGKFMISKCCVRWYENQEETSQIWPSFTATLFQLGALMVGSFVLAVVTTIRIIVEQMTKQHKENDAQNAGVKAMMKCLKCCLWCFEKCLKFITENAVIHMSQTGDWFCTSCVASFTTVMSNMFLFAIIGFLASGFEILGVLLITLANTTISYFILTQTDPWQDTVTNAVPALVTVVFISLIISLTFMNVWGFSCRALLYITLQDQKDGQLTEKCPMELRKLIDDENEKDKASKMEKPDNNKQ